MSPKPKLDPIIAAIRQFREAVTELLPPETDYKSEFWVDAVKNTLNTQESNRAYHLGAKVRELVKGVAFIKKRTSLDEGIPIDVKAALTIVGAHLAAEKERLLIVTGKQA